MRQTIGFLLILFLFTLSTSARAQTPTFSIRGVVKHAPTQTTGRNAVVSIAEIKKSVLADENRIFEFNEVPGGRYQIIVHLDRVPDVVKTVEVFSEKQTIDFQLTLAPVSEQFT